MIPRFARPLSRLSILLLIFSFWIIFGLTLLMANIKGLMDSKYKMYHDFANFLLLVITGSKEQEGLDKIQSIGIAIFIVIFLLMIYFIISYCFVHSTKRYKQKYAYISNLVVSTSLFLTTFFLLFLNLNNGLLLFLLLFLSTGFSSFLIMIASIIGCFGKTSYEFASNAKGE